MSVILFPVVLNDLQGDDVQDKCICNPFNHNLGYLSEADVVAYQFIRIYATGLRATLDVVW